MTDERLEKQRIRETVENWVLWRDAGDWQRFRTVWHRDGWMMATWFQGPGDRPDQDADPAARAGRRRGVRRRLHRAVLRFLRAAARTLGHRAASADLR